MKRVSVVVLLALLAGPAVSQQPVITTPRPATSANSQNSGTIAFTNTFQTVFAATSSSRPRTGCSIQNNGTHIMQVTEGLGITNSAAQLAINAGTVATVYVGGSYNCETGNVALQGEIDITGTSGDAYYAAQY